MLNCLLLYMTDFVSDLSVKQITAGIIVSIQLFNLFIMNLLLLPLINVRAGLSKLRLKLKKCGVQRKNAKKLNTVFLAQNAN